jgi:DNA-binding CsgD family transcriptional regulator
VRAVIENERLTRSGQPAADPRRRHGRHAEARRLLAGGGWPASVGFGVWDGLLSALHLHTIQTTLAALREREREVLRMAYLEGRSNREIAAILSVSPATARRRISSALAVVEAQIRRTGTRVSAILVLLGLWAAGHARAVGRSVSALRATPAGNVVLLTTAGAAASVVVAGAVIANPGAAGDRSTGRTSTTVTAGAPFLLWAPSSDQPSTGTSVTSPGTTGREKGNGTAAGTSGSANGALDPGCDGNPTNAPPVTPVGPRGSHPAPGSPVSHPGRGGCGPHGTEHA